MKLVRWLLYLVVAAVALIIAAGNKQLVQLHLNPLDTSGASLLTLPPLRLSVVIMGAVLIGFVLGGVFMWFRQHQYRKNARVLRTEAKAARSEVQQLKEQAEGSGGKLPALS